MKCRTSNAFGGEAAGALEEARDLMAAAAFQRASVTCG